MLKDAETLVKHNKKYKIAPVGLKKFNRVGLYKVTKDKNGSVGDFLIDIATDEDFNLD
jgi:hypothetical protein